MHVAELPDSPLDMLEIRALNVEDLSTARYVASAAFLRAAAGYYSAAEAAAFADYLRSPHHGDVLLGNRAYAGWIGPEMVGVGAWGASEARSPTARIIALFVHPMFADLGIGTRLADYLADEAQAAGYRALEASATLNAAPFFERLGYLEMRRGPWALPSGRELPIAFMRRIGTPAPAPLH